MLARKASSDPSRVLLGAMAAALGGLAVLAALAVGDSLRHGGEIRSIGVKPAYADTI